ncbi:MAG: hypothetical protein KA371_08460 [Acidobacteria bacterium]|nr:hypothetical protein [Acidobacteriota bacterium]
MPDSPRVIERFRTTVDLWATGLTLRRQAIRRNRPDASDEEVDALLTAWLQERPGAEWGDGARPDWHRRT